MSLANAERRPGTSGAALDVTAGNLDTASLSPAADALTHPRAVAPAYVVFTFDTDGRMVRRNVYVSLHSALRAKERAEKNGRRFQLTLCELVPVPHQPVIVVGGDAE